VRIKPLVTEKEDGLNVTCMLVNAPAGKEVPEHIHEKQDDIIYPLKGKGAIWVDGVGTFPLEPGFIVRVPRGVRHKVSDIKEELLVYDVFFPALL
jgi:quercetin dioxygenase-like cupin family protein